MKTLILLSFALVSATLLLTACSPSTPDNNEPMMPTTPPSTSTTAPVHRMDDGSMMSGATMTGMMDMSGSHRMDDGMMMSGATMSGSMDMSGLMNTSR